jgi:hypothetical protein
MNMVAVFDEIISRKPAASEWLAWAGLMRQTLCFGKTEDDLADSRLEKLTGLRRDRSRAAVRDVVGMGLFEIAGKGKYGMVYRIPSRFLGDDGYIGFNTNIGASMGASETDAYAEIPADEAETNTPEHGEAYQELVNANRNLVNANQALVESNRVLVNTNQALVETNRNLVNALPSYGEQLTKTRLNANQELVTDINKPKHNITLTTLNPDIGEEAEESPERWSKHWGQAEQGVDDFQVWGKYAALAAPASQTNGFNPEALQYPTGLSAAELAKAPGKLDGLHPTIAQDVLDTLAWKMANGSVKTPIGLLVYMANKAREGSFDRTPALEWRKGKQSAQAAKQDGITLVELNNLAIEIKAAQRLHKESGQEVFIEQAEAMKATYFQKLEAYKAAQVIGDKPILAQ